LDDVKIVSFDYKLTDIKFNIDKLVPLDVCKYFIDIYENNKKYAVSEKSYKYKKEKFEKDNYECLNLTWLSAENNTFTEPLNVAKKYIQIMIANYELHIKKNICPSFNSRLISNSDNIRIIKYKKGQYIKDHTDVGYSNISGHAIRASCTLNLNEDYEGGEFRFFNGRVKYSFKTGDAMLFPAEPIWIHGTEPVTKGARYSINCFLHHL
jgi:hypothetical protein